MDLLDFDSTTLYFEEALDSQLEDLLQQAGEGYADGTAELALLRAFLLRDDSLTVLVALYRFYFYQHRLDDALHIAALAQRRVGATLQLPPNWSSLRSEDLPQAAELKGLVRFYLLVLKGEAVMLLRLQRIDEAGRLLAKIVELDPQDRLGARDLLKIAAERSARDQAESQGLSYFRR